MGRAKSGFSVFHSQIRNLKSEVVSDFLAFPPARSVSGTVRVPPSKSATNRALVLAALSERPVEIAGPLESDDTAALARCLSAMGATIVGGPSGWRVCGPLGGPGETEVVLDAGDSGTAGRFLAAVAATTPGRFVLGGSTRLCERPMGELVEALRAAGAQMEYRGREGCLPLSIRGGRLEAAEVAVDASRSSQFLSALLLAAVAVEGGLSVRATGEVVSEPYVATTLEVLRDFGHEAGAGPVHRVRRGVRIIDRYAVPGDYSSAVALLCAAGVAGGAVSLTGLRFPSADADARALPVLEDFGMHVSAGPAVVAASADRGGLRPVVVRAMGFPDAVPALAALAAFAPGRSLIDGIGHLRLKESDRMAALTCLIASSGARAAATEGALTVDGPAKAAATRVVRLSTFRDHRIAMAAGLLALGLPGLLIEDPGCVAKSYPAFFRDLDGLAVR